MAVNWIDEYSYTENRIVLTQKQLDIPGIRTFGMQNMSDATLPLCDHYHENAFEIVCSIYGSLLFYVGRKEYHLHGGNLFLVHPNEIHSTHEMPLSPGKFYWVQLDIKSPEHFLFLEQNAAEYLIRQMSEIKLHSIRTDNKEISHVISKAFSLALQNGNPMIVASYIQIFLHLLLYFAHTIQNPMSLDISRSLMYIDDHLTSEISLQELADYCSLSLSRFKQKFLEEMGISPRHYINRQKISYAKTMLSKGCSITEVSMILGFSTSSYFSYVFKKYTLMTPTEYINSCCSDQQKQ